MSIRLRLALWYTAFLGLMFVVFAPAVYLTLERQLLREVDLWLAPMADRTLGLASARSGAVTEVLPQDLDNLTSTGVHIELLDANGSVVARSTNLTGRTVPVDDGAFAAAWWGAPASYTTEVAGSRYRAYLVAQRGPLEPRGFVLAARSLDEIDAALSTVRLFLLGGNLLGLLLAVAVGWLIAKRGLRPIEDITRTARAIAQAQDFSKRLRVRGSKDEVGRLAVTFNEMLDSLDAAYAAQRRFVADASHELRTPLTSIRSNVDILRRALDAPRKDREEALADVAAEVDRMSRLTSDLLLLARADAGHRIEISGLQLDEVVRDACRQAQTQTNGVVLELGRMDRVGVKGNQTWLKQLFLILVDNAVKYTPRGGSVTFTVERDGREVVARVSDTGIGIAQEDLPHVFERFYRADKARARDEGGAGLGLAIARWIADEHRGELFVESEPGEGTTFSLRLPVDSA